MHFLNRWRWTSSFQADHEIALLLSHWLTRNMVLLGETVCRSSLTHHLFLTGWPSLFFFFFFKTFCPAWVQVLLLTGMWMHHNKLAELACNQAEIMDGHKLSCWAFAHSPSCFNGAYSIDKLWAFLLSDQIWYITHLPLWLVYKSSSPHTQHLVLPDLCTIMIIV